MSEAYQAIAAAIVAMHDPATDVSECGHACGFVAPYGWVVEADCPIHDAPPPPAEEQA